jgi:hypothetical protein
MKNVIRLKSEPIKFTQTLSILFALVVSSVFYLNTHGQRSCGTMEYQQILEQEDPAMIQRMQEIEQFTRDFALSANTASRALVTIPVVVHVVYNTPSENISDAQIQSQITALNKDFRKLNSDASNIPSAFSGIAADVNIEFCLASVDPSGNPTNGIIRTPTSLTSFTISGNEVKYASLGGSNAWDSSKYLNIWVCDISGTLLGYGQFPGGNAATDGVVVDYMYFGTTGTATAPYNKGRTATHEIGHWMNLRHIWGDDGTGCTGSDFVDDTPNCAGPNYGCPTYPKSSCSNGASGDLFMNFMDYTDDACMYMFTSGQATRMQAIFATGGPRASLTSSSGCGTPNLSGCGAITNLAASSISQTSATIGWVAASNAVSYNVQYKTSAATSWINTSTTSTSIVLSGLSASSTYNVQVQAVCTSGTGSFSMINFTTSSAATPANCTDPYESNNSSNKAKAIAVNSNLNALISTATDVDWFKFNNTSSATNIRIELTGLPANFDVYLYNPSGTLISQSINTGTTAETINWNTTLVGTYKIRIIGAGGGFNASQCYTVRASISNIAFREGWDYSENETNFDANKSEIIIANVFPNPTNGKLNVILDATEAQNAQLRICDVTGRTALQHNATCVSGSNTFILDMESLPNGYYLLVIDNGKTSSTIRVVKN